MPVIPLPLKAFVICGGTMHMKVPPFLAVIFVARVIRYFGEAYLGAQIGEHSMQFLRDNVWTLAAVAAAFFVLLFALVRFRESRRPPAGI